MRGLLGGVLTGGLVSAVGLGAVSIVAEAPAGATPPAPPLVDAPLVEMTDATAEDQITTAPQNGSDAADGEMSAPADTGVSTPVGSVSIQEPVTPDLPDTSALPEIESPTIETQTPAPVAADAVAPRADTDPLDEPQVASIEGSMQAPETPEATNLTGVPVDPVLPNPQSLPPQTPATESDLTVSTAPAQPVVVAEPDPVTIEETPAIADATLAVEADPIAPQEDSFVIDLGPEAAPADVPEDQTLSTQVASAAPRVQLGGTNTLMTGRDTGVTIRRPGAEVSTPEAPAATNALQDFAASSGTDGSKPLMSLVLIDDGTMSAASAALAGLPFPATIAIDPALPNAADLMAGYRAAGFEVAVMAKVPEGARPSDVEVTFESIFRTLPESIAVLDIGNGGLQSDRAVTEQAMDILADQGRGFISASQGLNMAGRAAEQAGVPAAVVFRDLDAEGQDARVIRRFVDQAAFRARQDSGVVLVGRVRPDTISALILWGTANQDDQVDIVPVSAVLLAQ